MCFWGVAASIRDHLSLVLTLTAHNQPDAVSPPSRLEEAAVLNLLPGRPPVIITVCCFLVIVAWWGYCGPCAAACCCWTWYFVSLLLIYLRGAGQWGCGPTMSRPSRVFKCCGVIYFTDWLEVTDMEWPPDSCCTNHIQDALATPTRGT
ncbi:unnamed protein product [Arctogadus glacialis]